MAYVICWDIVRGGWQIWAVPTHSPPSLVSSNDKCLFLSAHRDEAEMEYLKIAQDLEMYGVNYFAIRVC